MAIINLQIIKFHRAALRLWYWSPVTFVKEWEAVKGNAHADSLYGQDGHYALNSPEGLAATTP